MKKLLFGGLAILAASFIGAPSLAADLPLKAAPVPAPLASWTGFYIGGGVGLRRSIVDGSVSAASETINGGAPIDLLQCPGTFPCVAESVNNTAFRFSPYAGYNWQVAPKWVVGVEGDFGFADKATTLTGSIYPGGGAPGFYITGRNDDFFTAKTTWDASVRGRVGFLVAPNFMVYGTAGAAWQHIEGTSICSLNGGPSDCAPGVPTGFAPGTITDSATRLGGTIGGGVETMLNGHWLLRAEYRFSDFGTLTNSDVRVCPPTAGVCQATIVQTSVYSLKLQTHTANFGIAYKF